MPGWGVGNTHVTCVRMFMLKPRVCDVYVLHTRVYVQSPPSGGGGVCETLSELIHVLSTCVCSRDMHITLCTYVFHVLLSCVTSPVRVRTCRVYVIL